MKVRRDIMKFLVIQKTTKSCTSPAPPTMPSLVNFEPPQSRQLMQSVIDLIDIMDNNR